MPVSITGAGAITGISSLNTTVDATELGYLDGTTSAIQTQINANLPGMQLITAQTFSGVSSVSVNNCFTSTYENYRIVTTIAASNSSSAVFRLRSGGTDNTSSNYNSQYMKAYGTTFEGVRTASSTSAGLVTLSAGSSSIAVVDILGPALSAVTAYFACGGVGYNGTSPEVMTFAGGHNVASSFDGITLFPTSGTISGTIRVYGLRNS